MPQQQQRSEEKNENYNDQHLTEKTLRQITEAIRELMEYGYGTLKVEVENKKIRWVRVERNIRVDGS